MSSEEDKRAKRSQIVSTINARLTESGERDQLKELLRARLVECGWKDALTVHCEELIKRKGLEKMTIDDLVKEITPLGRSSVPETVRMELLQRIRKFLATSPQ
ncbi:Transcription and mRNA export factor ENY2 [Plasmodiophora brassicae]|uniref:Transcription and mRNA export factor ENY2 n=1 Tax=Plasmodiophora brassicae TaxID=37360 RepID=A0A0G4IM11_PLABS|nr:hypothetical protein PBRA_004825 [Plasmodiophora brassicae]SPQ93320.1 unnamed protein product [Plasmodiophora brassicae]